MSLLHFATSEPRSFVVDGGTTTKSDVSDLVHTKHQIINCGLRSKSDDDGGCQVIDTEASIVAHYEELSAARRAHMPPSMSQLLKTNITYFDDDTINPAAMRGKTQKFINKMKDDFPYVRAVLDETAPSAMCQITRVANVEDENYMLGYENMFPWQAVAANHTCAVITAAKRSSATFIFHGMGSGKTRTIGGIMFKLYNPEKPSGGEGRSPIERIFNDNKPSCIFLLAPREKAAVAPNTGQADKAKAEKVATFSKYFKEVISHLNRDYPQSLVIQVDGVTKVANLSNASEVRKAVIEYIGKKTYMGNNRNSCRAYTEDITRPFSGAWGKGQWKDWRDETKKVMEDRIGAFESRNDIKLENVKFVIVVDEAHFLLNRINILREFQQVFADRGLNIHFVFASGTLNVEKVQKRSLSLFEGCQPPAAISVSYIDDIPRSIRPRIVRTCVGPPAELGEHTYQFFKDSPSRTATAQVLEPFRYCLEDFMKQACALDPSKDPHPKCVIVVPTRYAKVDNNVVIEIADTKSEEHSVLLANLFVEYVPNIASVTYTYNPGAGKLPVRVAPIQAFNTQPHVFGIACAGQTIANQLAKDVYGVGDTLAEKSIKDRKIAFGLGNNDKPPIQILVVSERLDTGLDLVGTTHVYFLGKPRNDTEYRQMEYRGVRVCSLAGRDALHSTVKVLCYGFEPPEYKANEKLAEFLKLSVDVTNGGESMYTEAGRDDEYLDVAIREMVAKHNYVPLADTSEYATITLESAEEIHKFIQHCIEEGPANDELVSSIIKNRSMKVKCKALLAVLSAGLRKQQNDALCADFKSRPEKCFSHTVKANVKDHTILIGFLEQYKTQIPNYANTTHLLICKKAGAFNSSPRNEFYESVKVPPLQDNIAGYRYFETDEQVADIVAVWDLAWGNMTEARDSIDANHRQLLSSFPKDTETAVFDMFRFSAIAQAKKEPGSPLWEHVFLDASKRKLIKILLRAAVRPNLTIRQVLPIVRSDPTLNIWELQKIWDIACTLFGGEDQPVFCAVSLAADAILEVLNMIDNDRDYCDAYRYVFSIVPRNTLVLLNPILTDSPHAIKLYLESPSFYDRAYTTQEHMNLWKNNLNKMEDDLCDVVFRKDAKFDETVRHVMEDTNIDELTLSTMKLTAIISKFTIRTNVPRIGVLWEGITVVPLADLYKGEKEDAIQFLIQYKNAFYCIPIWGDNGAIEEAAKAYSSNEVDCIVQMAHLLSVEEKCFKISKTSLIGTAISNKTIPDDLLIKLHPVARAGILMFAGLLRPQ